MPFPKCAKLDTRYTGVWKVLVTPPSYGAFCWESAWILLTLNSDEQKSLNSDVPAFSTNPISTATREGSRCLGAERQRQSPAWLMLITESGHLSHRILTCHKQHRHPVLCFVVDNEPPLCDSSYNPLFYGSIKIVFLL